MGGYSEVYATRHGSHRQVFMELLALVLHLLLRLQLTHDRFCLIILIPHFHQGKVVTPHQI